MSGFLPEGLPGVWRNKRTWAKKSKGTREHEPIIREEGNKTLVIKERKHGNSPSSDISAA